MILKIVQRSLSKIQPRIGQAGLLFLFSNQKKGNQFDKFKREKKNSKIGDKNSNSQQSVSEKGKVTKKQDQGMQSAKEGGVGTNEEFTSNFSNKQKNESKGFEKFQRVKHQKISRMDMNQQKTERPEIKEKLQAQNKVGNIDSFSKFKRTKKTNEQFQPTVQTEVQKKIDNANNQMNRQKDEINKNTQIGSNNDTHTTNLQNSSPRQQNDSGQMGKSFTKFQRRKSPRKPIQKSKEDEQEQKQKVHKQESLLHDKKPQQEIQEKKKQQKVEENIINSKTNEDKVSSMSSQFDKFKKKKAQEATQSSNKLSQEQKQKENFEKQLKDKEDHFSKKVWEFKHLKNEEHRISQSFFMSFKKYLQKKEAQIEALIHSKVGINLKSPPLFVANNPALFMIWKGLINVKFFVLFAAFYIFSNLYDWLTEMKEISSQQVMGYIEKGQVRFVKFRQTSVDTGEEGAKKTQNMVEIVMKNEERYKCVSNSDFQRLVKIKILMYNQLTNNENRIYIQNIRDVKKSSIVSTRSFLSLILFFLFMRSLFSGSGGNAASKSKHSMPFEKKSKKFLQKVDIKFNDVVGMQKAKEEVMQFIDFLKFPQKYHQLGARIPKGALLTGPPGTGKTMIAKACAGQSNVPFFTVSGSQFVEMYVGVGAQRVRDIFQQAKNAAPSIIFIDEIDAVGKKRSAGFGGNDQRDNTLNQLLVQMDGFKTEQNVIVFAATNQKDILDPALIRPGRFDRLIQIDLPDLQGRKEIFMVHLKPIVIDQHSSIQQYARRMATLTPGFSGAQIKNLCNEAAIMAARNSHSYVTLTDFQLATERIIAGVEKKSHLITPETKKVVAYHECGHGVVSWFLQNAKPLLKITIIPRSKGSLGFAQYLPHQTQISSKKQLQDQISVILGGRIAEQVFFGQVSTGAYDDLQKAYTIAKKIVTEYGMNKNIGWFSLQQSEYIQYYSKQTQKKIDEQIFSILKQCGERTRSIIKDKKQLIEKLADKLLEVETIDLTKISEILGDRPFQPNKQYADYLREYKNLVKQKADQEKFDGESNIKNDEATKEVKQNKDQLKKDNSTQNKIEMKKRLEWHQYLI